jgi:trans-aconitate 2-methyltransferase
MSWDPSSYNKFRAERMRPFYDCLQLVEPRPSMEIIDLGCGTGELTLKLAEHFPRPEMVLGIDSSPEMLRGSARFKHEKLSFRQATIEDQLRDSKRWDLIFSHAAIQWIRDHQSLLPTILSCLKPGGQLVIQMPAQLHNVTNRLLNELAETESYSSALKDWNRSSPVLDTGEYAEMLFRNGGQNIQVFEKIYPVVVKGPDALYDSFYHSQPFTYQKLQGFFFRCEVVKIGDIYHPPAVFIITFQNCRIVFDSCSCRKYQQGFSAVNIDNYQVPFIFFCIKGFHLPGIEKTRRVPFDLLPYRGISAQNYFTYSLNNSCKARFKFCDE